MHLGVVELLVVLMIVLLFVGPKQIPKLAETCGRAITSFKKGIKEDATRDANVEEIAEDSETKK